MTEQLRWGILSTAKIAREKLVPAIKRSTHNQLVAMASRSAQQAQQYAAELDIPMVFDDYQALLDSPEVDVIYNPLPNHLHVPWTIKALAAGKHVLCEKPIGLNAAEAQQLLDATAKYPDCKVMEAFMYRFHPQWRRARELLQAGVIGTITSVDAVFTYFNRDPKNVRNMPGIGGGGLLDIGCYCVSAARNLLDQEPQSVAARLSLDEDFQVDKHAQGIMAFGDVRASFFCSTQSEPSQRVQVMGEKGSLVLSYPFYQPDDCPAILTLYHDRVPRETLFSACDHYQLQVDALAEAIQHNRPVPTPLTDALNNMRVLDAIQAASEQNTWVNVARG